MRTAAVAVTTFATATPFAEVTQNETAVTVLPKPAGIVEHDPELLVLKFAARFEFLEIQTAQAGVAGFQNPDSTSLLCLYLFEIAVSLQ